jgi:hypothetical protein
MKTFFRTKNFAAPIFWKNIVQKKTSVPVPGKTEYTTQVLLFLNLHWLEMNSKLDAGFFEGDDIV